MDIMINKYLPFHPCFFRDTDYRYVHGRGSLLGLNVVEGALLSCARKGKAAQGSQFAPNHLRHFCLKNNPHITKESDLRRKAGKESIDIPLKL